jgi:uncharacterized membrane protein
MTQKDLYAFFLELKNKYNDAEIALLFENHDISKLDINRMYRYLDKYLKEDAPETEDIVCDDELDE